VCCANLFSQSIFENAYNSFLDNFSLNKNAFIIQSAPTARVEDLMHNKIIELQKLGTHFKFHKELSVGQYVVYYDHEKLYLKFLKHNNPGLINNSIINKNKNLVPDNEILGTIEYDVFMDNNNFYSFQMKNFDSFVNEESLV